MVTSAAEPSAPSVRAEALRLSVVVLTFNSRRFLAEQLASITAQTRAADEIVISDDGSSDGSVELALEVLKGTSADVRVTRGAHGGVVANLTRGLGDATGDVIVTSDHDDIWHPEKLAIVSDWFASHPDGALWFSDAELIDEDGRRLTGALWESVSFDAEARSRWDDGDVWSVLVRQSVVTGATAAMSRALVRRALPFPDLGWHDEWFSMLGPALGQTRAEPRKLVQYRLHQTNAAGVPKRDLRSRLRSLNDGGGPDDIEYRRWASFMDRGPFDTVSPENWELIRAKTHFQRWRRELPSHRIRRAPRVLRRWAGGDYGRFTAGNPTAVSDLIKPWKVSTRGQVG